MSNHYRHFKHLHIPDHWEQYWTRYPEGYTILEALLSWVKQVDDMVDNVNDLNNTMDEFIRQFDKELQTTVKTILEEWRANGFLAELLDQLLNQVQHHHNIVTKDLDERFINVKRPPANLTPAVGDGVTNDTEALQAILNYAYAERTTSPDRRLRVFLPAGTYLVNQLLIPQNANIYGAGRDNTTIKQVSGEVRDLLTDDPQTGAYSIRLFDLRLDGDGNSSNGISFGFHTPPSGYEFGMVWGVEGRMERVMARNFAKTAFRVRSSVTSMTDVIAINSGVGFAFYGGSLVGNHIIGHDTDKFIEFRGAGHKLFGVHYETGSDKTEPLIDFYNNSTDNTIHDLTVQINATKKVADFIRLQTPSFGNRVRDIKIQGISGNNITTFINDLQTRDKVTHIVSSYEQNHRTPVVTIGDTELNNLSYRIYPETANVLYNYVGSSGLAVLLMPRVTLAGIEVRISNTTDKRLRLNCHELDAGNKVFNGLENVLYIEPYGSLNLISNGSQFIVERHIATYPRNTGTVTISTGTTEATATHGLGNTPSKVIVTPKGNIGSVWASDIGTGQFKIYCSTPPETPTEVSWLAEL